MYLRLLFAGLFFVSTALHAQVILTPPTEPQRAMAEWEESEGLTITWTFYNNNNIRAILTEIVREAREEADVYILCADSNVVKTHLTSQNVDVTSRVKYVQGGFNSIWTRDYAGNTVYANEVGERATVDWIYNRPRPLDDASPVLIADAVGMPIYRTLSSPYDLVHTGGNYMSDGMGTAFSSMLVLEENGPNNNFGINNWSETEVDNLMQQFMGIDRYIKMENLPYDGIHHIDMHMKMLDESTLLVGQYPDGTADGPQIEANIQYVLDNFQDPWGQPYRIIRIPMPPDGAQYPDNGGDYRTYTNAVFVNKKVLVPIYTPQYDSTALRIWQEALPGYEIIGINCNAIIGFSGAIHCISHEIGVDEPLLIQHRRLDTQLSTTTSYPVEAKIQHVSGVQSAMLYYRLSGVEAYQSLAMTNTGNNIWTAEIPEQPGDTLVQYYIWAQAVGGKEQVRPLPAPAAYFQFYVEPDASASADLANNGLKSPFPNPAGALTCVPIHLTSSTEGLLTLHDILGREIQVIHNGVMAAGDSRYYFDAGRYAAGAYYVRLQMAGQEQAQVLLIK